MPKSLIELYRAHQGEIDTLVDPTALFVLMFVSELGRTTRDGLGQHLNLPRDELARLVERLNRAELLATQADSLSVTPAGQQFLRDLGFGTGAPPPPKPPRPPNGGGRWLPFFLGGIAVTAALIILILLANSAGVLRISGLSETPTRRFIPTPTETFAPPPPNTQTSTPTTTNTATSTATATSSATATSTATLSPTSTGTPTQTATPSRTRTPTRTSTPDTIGPRAPIIVAPKNNVNLNCWKPNSTAREAVVLDWNAPFDPSGIKNYRVRLQTFDKSNGTWGGPDVWDPVLPTFLDVTNSTKCGWAYRWRLLARDNANNDGEISDWAYFQIFAVVE